MSIKTINVGAVQNDGTGDPLRDAFGKVNENFAELDLLKAPKDSPALTGTPTAPTQAADNNTTRVATTAFVVGQAATVAPVMAGAAAVGASLRFARQDHRHPTDTTRAPLESPAFVGTPTGITKTHVGLGNVDNTSDANKPISTATQTALDGKAASSHSHAIANVTGLQAALDGTVKTAGNQNISGEKNFTGTVKAPNLFIQAQTAEGPIGWQFSDRAVYLFGRPADVGVGLYDSVGVMRFTADRFGNFTATGNVTAYSDIRLKTDLAKITDALSKVSRLNGYTYTRKDTGTRQTGVVAQELQEVLPEAVIDNGEHLAVAYGNIVGLLIEAIKELKAEVDQLKGK